jgi:hypothetical protein
MATVAHAENRVALSVASDTETPALGRTFAAAAQRAAASPGNEIILVPRWSCDDEQCVAEHLTEVGASMLVTVSIEQLGVRYEIKAARRARKHNYRVDKTLADACSSCTRLEADALLRRIVVDVLAEEPKKELSIRPAVAADTPIAPEATTSTNIAVEGRFGAWTYVTAGAALGFVALGTGLIAVDGPSCTPETPGARCPERRSTLTPGLVSLGVGAAVASLAGWMYWSDRVAVSATVAPTVDGARASVSLVF